MQNSQRTTIQAKHANSSSNAAGRDEARRRIEGMTPEEVLQFAKDNGAKMVDLKFVDLPGSWQHFSIPARELKPEIFVEGVRFGGTSRRGFHTMNESDMHGNPDANTAA